MDGRNASSPVVAMEASASTIAAANETAAAAKDDDESRPGFRIEHNNGHLMLVSYVADRGELFCGVLLKMEDSINGAPFGISREQFRLWQKMKDFQDCDETLDLNNLSSAVLRRTYIDEPDCCNSATDNCDKAVAAPAGIRRPENRMLRLRRVVNQRSSVLCAKCQRKRINVPSITAISIVPNPAASTSVGASSATTLNSPVHSKKRGCSEIARQPTGRRAAGGAAARVCDAAAAASASAVVTSVATTVTSVASSTATCTSSSTSASSPEVIASASAVAADSARRQDKDNFSVERLPTLKISFGKNNNKTTTVISRRYQTVGKSSATSSPSSLKSDGPPKLEAIRPHPTEIKDELPLKLLKTGTKSASSVHTATKKQGNGVNQRPKAGDIVWAKLKGYSYWPAKIFELDNKSACVTWCGSTKYGYVGTRTLDSFHRMFPKYYKSSQKGHYQKAVAAAILECRNLGIEYDFALSSQCLQYLKQLSAAEKSSSAAAGHGGPPGDKAMNPALDQVRGASEHMHPPPRVSSISYHGCGSSTDPIVKRPCIDGAGVDAMPVLFKEPEFRVIHHSQRALAAGHASSKQSRGRARDETPAGPSLRIDKRSNGSTVAPLFLGRNIISGNKFSFRVNNRERNKSSRKSAALLPEMRTCASVTASC